MAATVALSLGKSQHQNNRELLENIRRQNSYYLTPDAEDGVAVGREVATKYAVLLSEIADGSPESSHDSDAFKMLVATEAHDALFARVTEVVADYAATRPDLVFSRSELVELWMEGLTRMMLWALDLVAENVEMDLAAAAAKRASRRWPR